MSQHTRLRALSRSLLVSLAVSLAVTTVASAALLTLAPATASATTLIKLSQEELVNHSEEIVHGRVKQLDASLRGGRVYTTVTLTVVERLKGANKASEVQFTLLGGRTKRLATYVPGQAVFRKGEEVVVFLERPPAPGASLVVTGMTQGKMRVVRSGQYTYVVSTTARTPLVTRGQLQPVGPLRLTDAYKQRPTTARRVTATPLRQRLDTYKRAIKALVAKQATQKLPTDVTKTPVKLNSGATTSTPEAR